MAESTQGSKGSVFISYSRKDKEFVRALNDALDGAGVQAWVDWEGIELASNWMETISAAIQGHDAFIFVISPDSLKSKVCADELELGLKFNKKLIPILYREPTKSSKMHEKLASTNWVYLRKQDNFDETIPRLVESIQTDLEWVSQNTQILGQALEWESKNKNNSFLLHGTKLQEAERWLADASGKENREVLPIQADYISTGRVIATRNQRRLTITMSLLVVAAIVFGIFALISREQAQQAEQEARASEATAVANENIAATQKAIAEENQLKAEQNQKLAEEKTNIANAERSAAQAQILQTRAGSLDESTLLAIESYNLNPTFQAENLIRINTSRSALPIKQLKQDGAIWNIEWSPDFNYFVTGNNTDPSDVNALNEACIYRANDGEEIYCVEHDEDINDALFTKDGTLLVTASADQTVRFWDANDGSPVNQLTFEGAILDLDVNDSIVAIARDDNFLSLYYLNKPDLKPNPINVEQEEGVRSLKFSPNGTTLAFGLQNGRVRFWNADNNFFYNGPTHEQSSYVILAWSPDNRWLASGGGDSLAMLTKRDGTPQFSVSHQDWVEGLGFGPDPSWFATASDDNIIRVIATETGEELFRMSHTHFAQRAIVSSDGQWIASTGYDHVVRIWDSISGTQMMEIPLDANGSAISFNDDSSLIVAADEDGNVSIWDISKLNTRVGYIEFTEFVREANFTPSGEFLIVNADDYHVWKIPGEETGQTTYGPDGEIVLTTESLTYDTAISPDSNWIAVVELDTEDAQKNQGTLVSLDGKNIYHLVHGGEVTAVGFTEDSKLVATAGVDGSIKFWDVVSGQKTSRLNNAEKIYSMEISPAGAFAAAGLHDKTRIWNLSNNQEASDLAQAGDIVAVTFSRDGNYLATGSTDGTVVIWKIEGTEFTQNGDILRVNGYPRKLVFSPDNKWLAAGGSTGFAYLWDVASVQELARIPHGSNPVTSVSFSIDSKHLFAVSRKVVRIWNLSTIPQVPREKIIGFACLHLTNNLGIDEWTNFFGDAPYHQTCPSLEPKKE